MGNDAFKNCNSLSVNPTSLFQRISFSYSGSVELDGLLYNLIRISPSLPIITNITSIVISDFFALDSVSQSVDFGWFPKLQLLSIGKYSFQSISSVIFTGNTDLISIVIDDFSFISCSSVTIHSIAVVFAIHRPSKALAVHIGRNGFL